MAEKKHLLIVSQYFHPETFRINDMAQEWVRRGYRVTVLTGIPNYPMGKFFTGYSWFSKRKETWKGMEIIRIPLIARGKTSIGMVLNYLSFVISGWFWKSFTGVKADLVFSFEVSPMTQVKIGCWYSKKHNIPHFVYVQDLWPENVETVTGIHSKLIITPIHHMVDRIYRQVDQIFVTSPSFVEAIVNRKVPVDSRKVHYWPQYAEEFYRVLPEQDMPEWQGDNSFKIAFTGNVGTAQGLDILPKTAELLMDEPVRFVIVGDGRYLAEFEQEIQQRNVTDKFIMIPRQPAERIPEILSACDAGFISFNKTPLWEMSIPAKLQSYMACGKAIVASASGETKRIIEEAECGICTAIGEAEALAEGIRTMMKADVQTMGNRARTYFERHFDKQILMDQMDDFFRAMEKY